MNARKQWLDGLLTMLVFVAIGAVAVRCGARADEFSLEGAAPGNDAAAEGLPADHSPSTPN